MIENSNRSLGFFSLAERFIDARSASSPPIGPLSGRIFSALHTAGAASSGAEAARLPVCRHLDTALENARAHAGDVSELAAAFSVIAPTLKWHTRAGAATHGAEFLQGHANAVLLSLPNTEQAGDVQIGVSLMAPHTHYPMHHHHPDEIYIVMSAGDWFQETAGWFTPGVGNLVFNSSDLVHAMRSGNEPLLAFWFLGSPAA